MIIQLVSVLLFQSFYSLYFYFIWMGFRLLHINYIYILRLLKNCKFLKINIQSNSIIYFLYTINLYFYYYLNFKINLFNMLFFKKKFTFYWCYIFNFFFIKKLLQTWLTDIFCYKYLLIFLNFKKKLLFINWKKLNYQWCRLLINNFIYKFKFKLKHRMSVKLIYNLFISYYFLYFSQILHFFYFYFKSTIVIHRSIFLFYKLSTDFNWLIIKNIMNFYFIKSYIFAFFYKYNNFLFYKWCYLLIYFKINNSLLTLITPLRTLIVLFHKKHVLLPHLTSNFIFESKSLYNKFIFFTTYANLINFKLQINIIWIAVLVPKSYYLARIQFFYYHHKIYTYQKQITKFIFQYYKLTVFELFKNHEFIIKNIILRSQLCFLNTFIELFFQQNFIFLNFICLLSLYIVIYPFDIISFVVSSIFFLFYQWQILYIDLKFNKFLYYSKYWIVRSRRMFPKQNSFRLPHWVIFYRFLFFEIPIYLEVDFFVLSIILLNYYYLSLLFYYYFSFKETSFMVIRNYNWKLLN